MKVVIVGRRSGASTAARVRKHSGYDQVAFLSGGMITFHRFHRTRLRVDTGGMPIVAHAEDQLGKFPDAREQV